MTTADKTLRIDRTMLNPKKPNGRSKTLAMAIAAGLAAALLAFIAVGRHTTQPTEAVPVPTTAVVVAAQDIPARTLVTDAMLKINKMQQPPSDYASRPVDLVGKVTVSPITAGQAVTNSAVVQRGVEMGLTYGIPAGRRAMAIALDPISSVAGFIKPNDHVDVVATFDAGNGQSTTRTILQNITLLATGSEVLPSHSSGGGVLNSQNGTTAAPEGNTPKPQEIPNATLLVTPEEAQKLVMAGAKGKLQLMLRPADDVTSQEVPILHSSAVTGIMAPRVAVAPVAHIAPPPPPMPLPAAPQPTVMPLPAPATVTVIRGSDSKVVTVTP